MAFRVIFDHQVDPDRAGEAEHIDKEDGAYCDKQAKGSEHTPTEDPMQEEYEKNTEPSGDNIGDEHCPVIETGFGHIRLAAARAAFGHTERFPEGKSWCREQIAFAAFWAFKAEYAPEF